MNKVILVFPLKKINLILVARFTLVSLPVVAATQEFVTSAANRVYEKTYIYFLCAKF